MKIKNSTMLLWAVLLLVPVSSCTGNAPRSSTEQAAAAMQENAPVRQNDPEANTAKFFDGFVREVIEDSPSKNPNALLCTQFANSSRAFAFLLASVDADKKTKERFGETNRYESDYLKLQYTDKNVRNGFARLELTFKQKERNPTYTIVFRSPAE